MTRDPQATLSVRSFRNTEMSVLSVLNGLISTGGLQYATSGAGSAVVKK